MLEVSICVTYPLIRFSAPAHVARNKVIRTVPIERLISVSEQSNIFELTEGIALRTQGLIDVFAFLNKAQFR
jgi:hypothetical protein